MFPLSSATMLGCCPRAKPWLSGLGVARARRATAQLSKLSEWEGRSSGVTTSGEA